MKYFTEFIIYHEDIPMPEGTKFCPLLWKADDFDSDGDFYYDTIDSRWTELELESKEPNELNSKLCICVYREHNRHYDPSLDALRLRRYIEYKIQGEYDYNTLISKIEKPAIASFQFETYNNNHYLDFLKTISFFLKYSEGCLVNSGMYHNAEEFAQDFLADEDI